MRKHVRVVTPITTKGFRRLDDLRALEGPELAISHAEIDRGLEPDRPRGICGGVMLIRICIRRVPDGTKECLRQLAVDQTHLPVTVISPQQGRYC